MTRTGRIVNSAAAKRSGPAIGGKIKVGILYQPPGEGKKPYPKATDYFVATGPFAHHFEEAFGEKPTTIPIAFISDHLPDVCEQRYELRGKDGRRWGYGDGEEFMIWNEKSKLYEPFTLAAHPDLKAKTAAQAHSPTGWTEILELTFVIPAIRSVVCQWRFTTAGSASSIPAIIGAFDFVQEYGTVVKVPFDLTVEKVTSQKPGSKSVFPVVNLVPNLSTEHLEMLQSYLGTGHDVRDIRGMLTEASIEDATPYELVEGPQTDAKELDSNPQANEPQPVTATDGITDEQYALVQNLLEGADVDPHKFGIWVGDTFGDYWPNVTAEQAEEIIKALRTKQPHQ